MHHTRTTAALTAGLLAFTALTAQAAAEPDPAAGDPKPDMTISPTSGPVGTTVTMTGTGCIDDETGPGQLKGWIFVGRGDLFEHWSLLDLEPAHPEVAADGTWTAEAPVPASVGLDSEHMIATPAATFVFVVRCERLDDSGSGSYAALNREFEVTPSPTTTTPPTTVAPVTAPGPARPVEEAPPYTG